MVAAFSAYIYDWALIFGFIFRAVLTELGQIEASCLDQFCWACHFSLITAITQDPYLFDVRKTAGGTH